MQGTRIIKEQLLLRLFFSAVAALAFFAISVFASTPAQAARVHPLEVSETLSKGKFPFAVADRSDQPIISMSSAPEQTRFEGNLESGIA